MRHPSVTAVSLSVVCVHRFLALCTRPPLSLILAANAHKHPGVIQYGNQKGKKKMQPNDELSSSFDTDEDFGWVSYFLTLKGNELFCQVDDEYIQDKVLHIHLSIHSHPLSFIQYQLPNPTTSFTTYPRSLSIIQIIKMSQIQNIQNI